MRPRPDPDHASHKEATMAKTDYLTPVVKQC